MNHGKTHLPTEQASQSEHLRLSQPHEDSGRKKSAQPSQKSGTQASSPLSYTFPKGLRLRKSYEFRRLAKRGRRRAGKFLVLDIFQFPLNKRKAPPKLGITVSKRFGKAHERNRFKRRVREAFRLKQHELPLGIQINVRPRSYARGCDGTAIQNELFELIQAHDHSKPCHR